MEDEARYSRARERVLGRAWRMGKESKSNSLERQANLARKDGGLRGTDQSRYWEGVSPDCEMTNNCRKRIRFGTAVETPEPRVREAPKQGDGLRTA